MKTKMKHILAPLLIIAMLLGMSLSAFASTPPQINLPAGPNTFTIHHLTPAANIPPDTPGNIFTGQRPVTTPAQTPVPGAQWTLQRVNLPADFQMRGAAETDAAWHARLAALRTASPHPASTQTTSATGEAAWTGLPNGVYIFWQVGYENRIWMVHLPNWNPDFPVGVGQWEQNVHAFPKLTVLDPLHNKFTHLAVNNRIVWQINVEIMSDLNTLVPIPVARLNPAAAAPTHIRVIDTLDPRLIFEAGSVVVGVNNAAGNFMPLTSGTHFNVITQGTPVNTIIIDINAAGRDFIVTNGVVGQNIIFRLATTVDMTLAPNVGPVENRYRVLHGMSDDDGRAEEDLYGVQIIKRSIDNRLLSGAVFSLYPTEVVGGNIVRGSTPLRTGLTTGTDGIVRTFGLTEGYYYLIETQAPHGFELSMAPIRIRVDAVTTQSPCAGCAASPAGVCVPVTIGTPAAQVACWHLPVTVFNSEISQLPFVGGMGSYLFLILGVLVLIIGGAATVNKYRRKKEL